MTQLNGLIDFRIVQSRCRFLFQNHIMLMKKILHVNPVTVDYLGHLGMKTALYMALIDELDVGMEGLVGKSNMIFDLLYGLELYGKQLSDLLCNSSARVLDAKSLRMENITIVNFSHLGNFRYKKYLELYGCRGEQGDVSNVQLHESTIQGCRAQSIYIKNVRCAYTQISDCEFDGCRFNANLVTTRLYTTQFTECQFGTLAGNRGMRWEECVFEYCTFSNVDFGNIYVVSVTFIGCRFYNCTFARKFGGVTKIEDCEMDEISRMNFDSVNIA